MTTLTEFLLARIAEDEEAAGRLPADGHRVADGRVLSVAGTGAGWPDRWNPVRVLAECEAKRRIVALHPEMLEACQGCDAESYPCRTLLALALPYADHPDYREEWRP